MSHTRPASLGFLAVCLVAAAASSVAAQPLGTDLFVAHFNGNIVRVAPGGPVTTVGKMGGFMNMLTMDTDNRSIVALDTNPDGVLRVDPLTGTVVTLVWSGAPLVFPNWVEVDGDGDYIVADGLPSGTARLFRVKRDGSAIVTLHTSAARNGFNCFAEDKNTGDWVIGRWSSTSIKHLVHLDRDSLTVTTAMPLSPSRSMQGMTQDPHRPEMYIDADSQATIRSYNPVTHAVTTIATGLQTNSMTIDRAPAGDGSLLYAGSTSGVIQRYDRRGTNLGIFGSSGSNCMGLAFDESRNLGAELVTPPNHRIIRVNFQADASKTYVVAFGISGYTGGLTLLDGRVIPLTLDALALLTAQGPLPPFLTGNIGTLDPFGRAMVTLNLNALPVTGLRLWAVGLTLDPRAPLGISQISAPLLIVMS